jgi:hypothetical protein
MKTIIVLLIGMCVGGVAVHTWETPSAHRAANAQLSATVGTVATAAQKALQ